MVQLSRPLGAVFLASVFLAAPALRAQDKPSTASSDPKAEEKRKEELKKFQDVYNEIEKEWKDQKLDPAPALNYFQFLIDQRLELADCKALYKKVVAKKIPFDKAREGASKISGECLDKKTTPPKFDVKKFIKDYTKWINDWKPPKEEKPAPPPATTNK